LCEGCELGTTLGIAVGVVLGSIDGAEEVVGDSEEDGVALG
jgi:hypothetical protein